MSSYDSWLTGGSPSRVQLSVRCPECGEEHEANAMLEYGMAYLVEESCLECGATLEGVE